MPHVMSLGAAADAVKRTEATYANVYAFAHLPESLRRRIKDQAARAKQISAEIAKHERKQRFAPKD